MSAAIPRPSPVTRRLLVDGGYRLEWVRPVGQFRWSTHVELAACFTRDAIDEEDRRVEA